MELDEFVKQALLKISKGVKNSQEEIRSLGGYASPAVFASSSAASQETHFGSVSDGHNVLLVDFDVAVTTSDSEEVGGSGKISVVKIFSAEAGGKQMNEQEYTSRIHFKVPLALPVDEVTKQQLDSDLAQLRAESDSLNRNSTF